MGVDFTLCSAREKLQKSVLHVPIPDARSTFAASVRGSTTLAWWVSVWTQTEYSIQISGVIISEVYTGSGLALDDLLPGPMGLQFSLARIGFDDEKEATSTGDKLFHQILQFTEQGRRTVAVMIILTEMACELVMTSWGELVRSLSAEALNADQRATYRWN